MCSLASLPYRAYKKVWSSLKRSHNIELLIAMSVAHCSVFLILVFAIRLGHGATIPTLSSTAPTTIPRPAQLQGSSQTPINSSTVECEVNYYTRDSTFSRIVCRCDEQLCTQLSPNTLTIPLARSLCLVCCFLFLHVLVYMYKQLAHHISLGVMSSVILCFNECICTS